jgi:hypothetical protein
MSVIKQRIPLRYHRSFPFDARWHMLAKEQRLVLGRELRVLEQLFPIELSTKLLPYLALEWRYHDCDE